MDKILERLKADKNVLNIYTYGSAVYGLRNEKSDIDYIVVVNEKDKEMEKVGIIDFYYYSKEKWKELADRNNIAFIECIFLDNKYKDIVLSENNDWLYFKNLYQPENNKLKRSLGSFIA